MTTVSLDDRQAEGADRALIAKLFDEARKKLIETGTRNRLIHVNRVKSAGSFVNIVNEQSEDVFDIISNGKPMRFLAIGRDRDATPGDISLTEFSELPPGPDRFTDSHLETRMGPDALQRRLLKIAREAQTAEEESGVNILYLALGFLKWFEDKSSAVPREAPLVLLPVELVRNQRTSTYEVRLRDDDILTNLPLQQRLKDDFGIQLPSIEIGEDAWTPSTYFEQVEGVIASRQNWAVDRNAIQLGFFSFSKLLMYRDLAIEAWPSGTLADHALTRGLLYEGFESEGSLFGPNDRLDEVLPPEKLFHVVDADASQAQVVEEIKSGRNLIVQGPPGTGKSQTITNIIAAAANEGKRVLFVAEKMAALSVVHDRLVKVGLRDICLELHSRNASKKVVLAELARTLSSASAIPDTPSEPTALREARDRLNALAEAMHEPLGQTGETGFSVLAQQVRLIGSGAQPPTIGSDELASMTRAQEAALLTAISTYGELLAREGALDEHPFAGVRNLELQPVDLHRLASQLTHARAAVLLLAQTIRESANAVGANWPTAFATAPRLIDLLDRLKGLPAGSSELAQELLHCRDLPRLREGLEAGAEWRRAIEIAASKFVEAAFSTSVISLRGPLVAGTSFFARWRSGYRKASKTLASLVRGELLGTAAERVALIDELLRVDSLQKRWESDKDFCVQALGENWRGERTDFARLVTITQWCEGVAAGALDCSVDAALRLAQASEDLARLSRSLIEQTPFARRAVDDMLSILDIEPEILSGDGTESAELDAIAYRADRMAQSTDRYVTWAQLSRHHGKLVKAGLPDLALKMRTLALDGAAAATELRYARSERLWKAAIAASPALREMAHQDRHGLVEKFAYLERARLRENVITIRANHLAQVPRGALGAMKVIRGEIGKKRGHMAIRKLFGQAGEAVQRIKPVLLMSPISVAQFLPPEALSFDLLIIDEASQVRPEDALGAVARAKQIVVVGDQKQLPPSSFFDRLLEDDGDEEEEEADDLLGGAAKVASMESILTLCEARGLGSRMLKWHYRSRDPSLISVSNHEFYDDGLILPPSPLQKDPAYGLCFTRVDGVYDRGGKRDNRKEAEVIVARVAEHARAHPELSLGIVTFSSVQKNLITEFLELARRTDSVLDDFLRDGQSEDVFVKNIENVQGDERDVILVSVCYGPTVVGGRLASVSFGPVSLEGGERRLNVLFTRARVRCEVFASFDPGDIDPSRASRDGARILKRFLDFAKNGRMNDASPTGAGADTPFEEDVAEVIRSLGYLADPQVGSAGFRIDLGVRHSSRPGTYVLAVECDGATYHSALWARERDRLRQDVLERLGWRFHRIWSTDWFYHRGAEIQRLSLALNAAREAAQNGIRVEGANRAKPLDDELDVDEDTADTFEIPEVVIRQMPAYERAYFAVSSSQEPHEVGVATLSDLTKRIVAVEGPIHLDEVARRVAVCFGRVRVGPRIAASTRAALHHAKDNGGDIFVDDAFWFTSGQVASPPVRDRSGETGPTLKAVHLSTMEIRAALTIAQEDNAGGSDADVIRMAARLLGFRRVGPELQTRLASALSTES